MNKMLCINVNFGCSLFFIVIKSHAQCTIRTQTNFQTVMHKSLPYELSHTVYERRLNNSADKIACNIAKCSKLT